MYIENDTFLYRLYIRAVSILYPLYMRSIWFVRCSYIGRIVGKYYVLSKMYRLDVRIEILELRLRYEVKVKDRIGIERGGLRMIK